MCNMKLRPQDNEKQPEKPESIMAQMAVLLSEKDDIIVQKTDVIAQQKKRIAMLEEHLRLSNSKRFGPSSEQTPPEQGNLFNEAEALAEPEQATLPISETDEIKGKKGRKPLSEKLPRHQVFAYLTEEEKVDAIDILCQSKRRAGYYSCTSPCLGIHAGKSHLQNLRRWPYYHVPPLQISGCG